MELTDDLRISRAGYTNCVAEVNCGLQFRTIETNASIRNYTIIRILIQIKQGYSGMFALNRRRPFSCMEITVRDLAALLLHASPTYIKAFLIYAYSRGFGGSMNLCMQFSGTLDSSRTRDRHVPGPVFEKYVELGYVMS